MSPLHRTPLELNEALQLGADVGLLGAAGLAFAAHDSSGEAG